MIIKPEYNKKKQMAELVHRKLAGGDVHKDNPFDIREIELDSHIECDRYKIALVLSNNSKDFDYHFYRQDLNGDWSHKAGDNPISNIDASGNKITDPKIANRNYNKTDDEDDDNNDYNIFCGYYSVRNDTSLS